MENTKKKENQRVALTKRLLKESLLSLMEKKEIQKISISELCQRAGINRTTFYNHYGSQYDLLNDIELDVITDLKHIWSEENEAKEWSIKKRAEDMCVYFREHERVARLLMNNSNPDSDFVTQLFRSSRVQELYQQLLSDVQDPVSKELMLTFFMNGLYSLIRQWLLEDIPRTPKEMGELVYNISVYEWKFLDQR